MTVLTKGVAMAAGLSPSSLGGVVVSYSVEPPLPSGLVFNNATGSVSGAATVLAVEPVVHTVTATNSGGAATINVTLSVVDGESSILFCLLPAACCVPVACCLFLVHCAM